jgi:hypothetical protein
MASEIVFIFGCHAALSLCLVIGSVWQTDVVGNLSATAWSKNHAAFN